MSDKQHGSPQENTSLDALSKRPQNYHAFVCIFKDYKRLEALLLACIEQGLPGGTLIDSRGMGQILCQDIPLFIHLRDRFPAADGDSYLFLSVVTDDQLEVCFELAERLGQQTSQGVAFSLPVGNFRRFSTSQSYFSPQELEHVIESHQALRVPGEISED